MLHIHSLGTDNAKQREERSHQFESWQRASEGGQVSCRASTPILPPSLPSFRKSCTGGARRVAGAALSKEAATYFWRATCDL